jgi:hypothetical protein
MGTQRKGSKGISCAKGSYRRVLGKAMNNAGKIAPKRFLLGRDKRKAEAANAKLELLWSIVEDHHQARLRSAPPQPPHAIDHDAGPVWSGLELDIAEAIRTGKQAITVGIDDEVTHTPAGYASRLHWLNETYGHLVRFVPALPEEYAEGQEVHRSVSAHKVRQATHNAAIAQAPIPTPAGTQTLYEAIDAYADHGERQAGTDRMKRKVRQDALRIKRATPDMPLETFNYDAVERIGDYWRGRPISRRKGKGSGPIAITTVVNQCKVAKRFIRWLDRSDAWKWERPRDFETALAVNEKRLRTEEERARLARGPDTWNVADLTALYCNATDRERVLMLLGLNFGFAQAEIITLRADEIDTTGPRPILKRVRHKSEVYMEAAVWPETMRAIAWITTEHKRLGHNTDGLVWMSERGNRPTSQHVANQWNKLLQRTTRNEASFNSSLSFKYLRKTAGQLVREVSDGETAGVFLAHGTPVSSDDLLDAYTRRVFDRVFAANAAVRDLLSPMLAAATDAFATPRPAGSPNISRSKATRIKRLWRDNVNPTEIARIAGVSRQTVYRHRPKQADPAARSLVSI